MTLYDVGVRFTAIGDSSLATHETSIATKHWALVFSPRRDPTSSRLIELVKGNGGKVAMITTEFDFLLPSHPVATYKGELSDTDHILEAHPMRGTCYSAFFNNCQHFVAIFLHFLDAFALGSDDDRSFMETNSARIERVQSVLLRDGLKLYKIPCMSFGGARLKGIVGRGIASVATTLFDDPYFLGFPTGVNKPLSPEERTAPKDEGAWSIWSFIPYKSVVSVSLGSNLSSDQSYPAESSILFNS